MTVHTYLSFDGWMARLNALFASNLMGLDTDDLPDQNYWDMWNDDMTPGEAYREVIMTFIEDGELGEDFLS